jgi:cell wall-associated NlpC family hydrolase
MKQIKILIILMFTLNINSMAQNQFSDYVTHLKNDTLNLKRLESFVMEWYGIKYQLGGNTKNGIDCSQFAKKLYWEVYGKKLNNTCAEQWKQTNRIKKDSLMVGDIVFFRSTQSPSGWHCGVYLGRDTFVHAANKKEGVKISSLSEPRYLSSYKGAGRFN